MALVLWTEISVWSKRIGWRTWEVLVAFGLVCAGFGDWLGEWLRGWSWGIRGVPRLVVICHARGKRLVRNRWRPSAQREGLLFSQNTSRFDRPNRKALRASTHKHQQRPQHSMAGQPPRPASDEQQPQPPRLLGIQVPPPNSRFVFRSRTNSSASGYSDDFEVPQPTRPVIRLNIETFEDSDSLSVQLPTPSSDQTGTNVGTPQASPVTTPIVIMAAASESRVYKAIFPGPSKYGLIDLFAGHNISEYITAFEEACRDHSITGDRDKVDRFGRWCDPDIKKVLERYDAASRATWEAFKAKLKERYRNKDHNHEEDTRILDRLLASEPEQTAESIFDHIEKAEALLARLPDERYEAAKKDAVRKIWDRFPGELKAGLRSYHPGGNEPDTKDFDAFRLWVQDCLRIGVMGKTGYLKLQPTVKTAMVRSGQKEKKDKIPLLAPTTSFTTTPRVTATDVPEVEDLTKMFSDMKIHHQRLRSDLDRAVETLISQGRIKNLDDEEEFRTFVQQRTGRPFGQSNSSGMDQRGGFQSRSGPRYGSGAERYQTSCYYCGEGHVMRDCDILNHDKYHGLCHQEGQQGWVLGKSGISRGPENYVKIRSYDSSKAMNEGKMYLTVRAYASHFPQLDSYPGYQLWCKAYKEEKGYDFVPDLALVGDHRYLQLPQPDHTNFMPTPGTYAARTNVHRIGVSGKDSSESVFAYTAAHELNFFMDRRDGGKTMLQRVLPKILPPVEDAAPSEQREKPAGSSPTVRFVEDVIESDSDREAAYITVQNVAPDDDAETALTLENAVKRARAEVEDEPETIRVASAQPEKRVWVPTSKAEILRREQTPPAERRSPRFAVERSPDYVSPPSVQTNPGPKTRSPSKEGRRSTPKIPLVATPDIVMPDAPAPEVSATSPPVTKPTAPKERAGSVQKEKEESRELPVNPEEALLSLVARSLSVKAQVTIEDLVRVSPEYKDRLLDYIRNIDSTRRIIEYRGSAVADNVPETVVVLPTAPTVLQTNFGSMGQRSPSDQGKRVTAPAIFGVTDDGQWGVAQGSVWERLAFGLSRDEIPEHEAALLSKPINMLTRSQRAAVGAVTRFHALPTLYCQLDSPTSAKELALLDCGSECNCISMEVVQRHRLPITSTNVISTGLYQSQPFEGETQALVYLGGQKVLCHFFIMKESAGSHGILLGMPFFRDTSLTFDFADSRLVTANVMMDDVTVKAFVVSNLTSRRRGH